MIGQNICKLLYEQRKTQVWLAKQCNVTKGHINQIIKGKVKPSLKLLLKISQTLNVSVEKILGT